MPLVSPSMQPPNSLEATGLRRINRERGATKAPGTVPRPRDHHSITVSAVPLTPRPDHGLGAGSINESHLRASYPPRLPPLGSPARCHRPLRHPPPPPGPPRRPPPAPRPSPLPPQPPHLP